MDEVWHDVDDRREQGLRPAMVTREDAQLLVCSTAGTAGSTVYNRKVEAGRRAAGEDAGHGMAYIEYSAPDDWNPEDRESWWSFMPALGHTITPTRVEQERLAMGPGEFRRAYGNRPTPGVDVIIPLDLWERVCSSSAKPEGELRFGVDIAEDRSMAAITAAGANGSVELIEYRAGTGWVADRCNELTRTHGAKVGFDAGGPAGVLADDLTHGDPLAGREVLYLCGALYDAIVEGQIVFRRDQAFDAAIAGAVKKPVGDLWAWSRKGSMADVTPLMAATVSLWGNRLVQREPMIAFA